MKFDLRNCSLFIFSLFLITACSKKTNGPAPAPNPPSIARVLTQQEVDLLKSAGMDTLLLHNMVTALKKGEYPNIHSVLIAKNKKLIFERYFPGKDENFGSNMGVVTHSSATLHDIRSISKSIVSACVGIAISQGLLTSVDQNVFDFFPQYISYKTGVRENLTIRHLLTMSAGMEWNENLSYTNPMNSEIQMTSSVDPVEFVLSRPMINAPGEVYNYNGGATHVLGAIVESVSGKDINQFANEYLFTPLGITHYEWNKYSKSDQFAAASGLRLRSGDLMKFGLLYADEGKWLSQQIIPASWVQASFSNQINRAVGAYGYQFFILPEFSIAGHQMKLPAAIGNGDQRIFFDKPNDLIMVFTAGNYNEALPKNALAVAKDFIYPSIF